MTVSLAQWRAVVGTFNCRSLVLSKSRIFNISKNLGSIFECLFLCLYCFENFLFTLLTLLYIISLLRCHGDIELNPGPRKSKENTLSVCHWNLNSISAHNFSKLTQLRAYTST